MDSFVTQYILYSVYAYTCMYATYILMFTCALRRTRMNEVSLVLKSVTILISALKDAQKTSTAKSEKFIIIHAVNMSSYSQ